MACSVQILSGVLETWIGFGIVLMNFQPLNASPTYWWSLVIFNRNFTPTLENSLVPYGLEGYKMLESYLPKLNQEHVCTEEPVFHSSLELANLKMLSLISLNRNFIPTMNS